MLKLIANLDQPPLAALAAAELTKEHYPLSIEWAQRSSALLIDGSVERPLNTADLLRAIARSAIKQQLYCSSIVHQTQVDGWLTFAQSLGAQLPTNLALLERHCATNTFLVANRLSIADLAIFEAVHLLVLAGNSELGPNTQRWYALITQNPAVAATLQNSKVPKRAAARPSAATEGTPKRLKSEKPAKAAATSNPKGASAAGDRKLEGKFIELPGARHGEVVVRFPPEASGYLHIGHAKAALLNQYYQQAYAGKLIMRFDDTNPAKETVEFEQVILEDLKLLEIQPDVFTHTSDYFDLMLEYCERLLADGKAYADDTPAEQMRSEREALQESANRSNSVARNQEMWQDMLAGNERGLRCCIRARIDMKSPNGCLRDPTIYRCKNEAHPKTGTKYRVYPTYDFACPIVDAIEGVTHTLRTTEYLDRDAQFFWFIDALQLRRPHIWSYSRLNMTNTVLSKRKLTWFVNSGQVTGWDDARFPTVRGVLRRGMTVQGLREFIIAQGSSKSVVFMEWDKIWAFNKKVIDPIAPRYTALEGAVNAAAAAAVADSDGAAVIRQPVVVLVDGQSAVEEVEIALHPKSAEVGTKRQFIGPRLLIDASDADELQVGEFATFINWGNMLVQAIERDSQSGQIRVVRVQLRLDNTDFKKTLKLTWLCDAPQAPLTPTICVYFEHIISKAVLAKNEDYLDYVAKDTRREVPMRGEPALRALREGDIIQLTRRGFFRVDRAWREESEFSGVVGPLVLFAIPDGHTKALPTSGSAAQKTTSVPAAATPSANNTASDLSAKIVSQGDLVRDLKAKKAAKPDVEEAVKCLLALKADYKQITGIDWKPSPTSAAKIETPVVSVSAATLDAKISAQGDLVRDLKAKKAAKPEVEAAVKSLLALKADYKQATGQDWKPNSTVPIPSIAAAVAPSGELNAKITAQGDLVRDLKAKKAAKPEVEAAVKSLLALKADYKQATGQDWKPNVVAAVAAVVAAVPTDSGPGTEINRKIVAQGDLVRDLKAKKAAKTEIEAAVKSLLALKSDYKQATGQDWKPGCVSSPSASAPTSAAMIATGSPAASSSATLAAAINTKIIAQGDLVRDIKAKKAAKPEVEAAVKSLLALKSEYKQATGQDWKPGCVSAEASVAAPPPAVSAVADPGAEISSKIVAAGDRVRDLKAKKAAKPEIEAAVKILLALKTDYKQATGLDWKPPSPDAVIAKPTSAPETIKTVSAVATAPTAANTKAADINAKIVLQGDVVRDLKSKKASKPDIDAAVKSLLALKADYKSTTGADWKPPTAALTTPAPAATTTTTTTEDPASAAAVAAVNAQSEVVRTLKANKAAADDLKAAVAVLLSLKADYKQLTGKDFPVVGGRGSAPKPAAPTAAPQAAPKAKPAAKPKVNAAASGESAVKKQTRLGLEALKSENLPEWYSQVITKAEMIEYYDVSGCYILRPAAISIWRSIQNFFQDEITKLGVKECYFPMFVSKAALEKEKAHIADFSPEVAWVTRSGDSELAEPIAIRPTSETIMYPAFAKWIQSYRDLPLKLNQWSNVCRWEFKHPQPFLRTREFLWQEGHTAYADLASAEAEVMDILQLYARIYEELLAIPVRRGRKSEKEKFAGGSYTTTVEAFVSASGRSIQGATSHHLGQNFSRMFDIIYEDPVTQEKQHVYQNSWGITTRTIGVMIMVHGDDTGLVIPPRVAPTQAVVVPCGVTVSTSEDQRAALQASCVQLEQALREAGVRVEGDYRDNYSPGWKFNHWELKGTPIRVELGPKDMLAEQLVLVRRDTGEKLVVRRAEAGAKVVELLAAIQANLFARAQRDFVEHMVETRDWPEFCANLERKNLLCSPFCGGIECEDQIKEESTVVEPTEPGAMGAGAKSLCIPFDQPAAILPTDRCINPHCSAKPKHWCYFGRSY